MQAPAREALQLIEESRRPEPDAPASRPAAPPAAAPPERGRPPTGARPRPDHPAPAPRAPERRRTDLPDLSKPIREDVQRQAPGSSDVCALGRRYGGWRADSPEATICRDTYGR
ncbi:hypothetical protein [Streptomyces sp. bgisy032]|uniref:hypothetical protein n=1 Tax=Streptomyces sp. bgisy032 TaxID=3413773 RepID=UPI003D74F5C9